MRDWIAETEEQCIDCGLCSRSCAFLQRHGSPKFLAARCRSEGPSCHDFAFECSLCNLCDALCPVGVTPSRLFLELRRNCARRGHGVSRAHGTLISYERRGTSRRYRLYAVPRGCRTVLFPGCALAGSRPTRVLQLLQQLRRTSASVGVVLDCCTRPSHDLGRDEHFRVMFQGMRDTLLALGVETVISACPSCHEIFRGYGGSLEAVSVYEALAEIGLPAGQSLSGVVTIHDPCTGRFDTAMQDAVRDLARGRGLTIEEMSASREKTICCGEGGAVSFVSRELAGTWRTRRREEAQGRRVLCYCAGCAGFLESHVPAAHVLDLVMEPESVMAGKVRVWRAPWTYLNRMLLKRRLKQWMTDAVFHERLGR